MTRRTVRPSLRTALAVAVIGVLSSAAGRLDAQAAGRVVGRIVDQATGQGLADVGIQIVGTTIGTMSGVDGRYSIAGVPAGTVTIHVRRLGYQAKTVTGIVLPDGGTIEQNVALGTATVQLQALEVTASAERGTVSEALDQQRNAVGVVNAVTAEQISRSPDGDAAAAVQRVSGVTVQDGKFVFVRGLGERYTTTSLNGARIPSPEPERKVVPLDLFPAALLQSVTTAKTFTPDQPGDFSGAQVDIRTREFPAKRQITYSASVGFNDRATGKDVPAAPTEGLEWLGFGAHHRALPTLVAAQGNFSGSYTPLEYGRYAAAFRNVWSARERSGSPNSSFGVTVGGSDPVFGRPLGYVGSLTYSYAQEVRSDEVRALAGLAGDGRGTSEVNRFDGRTGRSSVLWGGLLNLSSMIGANSRVSLNNTFTRGADNEARSETGFDEDDGVALSIQRLRYVERFVRSSQLAGEHQLGAAHRVDWQVTTSGVTRKEPDRSAIAYVLPDGGAPQLYADAEAAVRIFGDLAENNHSVSGDYSFRFGPAGREHVVKIGALGRYTHRDAANIPYYLQATPPPDVRNRPPEEIFDAGSASGGSTLFRVGTLFNGGSYEATDAVGAGYALTEWPLGQRLRLIGGARVEHWHLEVDAAPNFGTPETAQRHKTDLLPAVTLNVKLRDDQNLRLSVSQTLARPEYREVANIGYYDVIGGEIVRGNPSLTRTLIQNADVRWEWYPSVGEVVSAGVFAKRFQDPIERIYRATSGTPVTTFQNADGAYNFGAELEVRKGLGFVADALARMTAFSNLTVMRSEIDLAGLAAGSLDENRPMVGQAPYVVNAGLSYITGSGGASATALYNVVGRRLFSASIRPLPNVYEEARHVLDLSIRFPLTGSLSAKVDARNLLDEPFQLTQGTVRREYYRAGRVFSTGLTWRP